MFPTLYNSVKGTYFFSETFLNFDYHIKIDMKLNLYDLEKSLDV